MTQEASCQIPCQFCFMDHSNVLKCESSSNYDDGTKYSVAWTSSSSSCARVVRREQWILGALRGHGWCQRSNGS